MKTDGITVDVLTENGKYDIVYMKMHTRVGEVFHALDRKTKGLCAGYDADRLCAWRFGACF